MKQTEWKREVWFRGGGMCARVLFSWEPTQKEIDEAGNEAYIAHMKEKKNELPGN